MARILMLTDRPQTDDRIVSRTVELADRLEAEEVSFVVTRPEDGFIATGCSFGVPDAGLISPCSSSLCALSPDRDELAMAISFLSRCRQDAAFHGLTCETARSAASLRRTAAMLAGVVGLMVVSRESLLDGDPTHESLRMLWLNVKRPWLICPTDSESWKRVIVATRNDAQRNELIAWGRHWSERFDVPLALIALGTPPPRSLWSTVRCWLRWHSRQHREAVRQSLFSCGLGPGDLLLVDREPSTWSRQTHVYEATLDDLIAVAPCSVGVAPTTTDVITCELLFPHGLSHADEPIPEIVAA